MSNGSTTPNPQPGPTPSPAPGPTPVITPSPIPGFDPTDASVGASTSVRIRPQDAGSLADSLGPLENLVGTWIGTGFNLIWRPNFAQINGKDSDHFLELNLTQEITRFDFIGSNIPNRGLAQADIFLFGLHYLQQVSDLVTRGALHIEPGIWVNIPESQQPAVPASVARLSTIPHGNALVAQGQTAVIAGGPSFTPVNVSPFLIGGGAAIPTLVPELTLTNPSDFRSPPPPPNAMSPVDFQATVLNPNSMLARAIVGQNILNTTKIDIATAPSIKVLASSPVATPGGDGGIENIEFLQSIDGTSPEPAAPHTLPNAVAADIFATFYLEEIDNPFGPGSFFQLQYSQTVHLNFANLTWPHVSVATLVRSSVV